MPRPNPQRRIHDNVPQHPYRNARRLEHDTGLASSAFARHYSRNHNCFLFLRVLRCFTSPRSLLHPMHSDTGNTTSLVPGFPIRTSSDPRSVDSSPRHIAASHVLHRLLMPRHPPCALKHLQTQKNTQQKTLQKNTAILLRCSQPLSNTQTPHPTTKTGGLHSNNPSVVSGPNSVSGDPYPPPHTRTREKCCCAPGARHYSSAPLHGSHPTQMRG